MCPQRLVTEAVFVMRTAAGTVTIGQCVSLGGGLRQLQTTKDRSETESTLMILLPCTARLEETHQWL